MIDTQVPAQYILARVCWADSASGTSGEGLSHALTEADTLTWDLGYTSGVAWSQVQGGDVYASATLQSYVPAGALPYRAFILDGTGGYPGVATYRTDYDFDSGPGKGESYVSDTEDWLVNDASPDTDFYQLMYRQFGPPAPTSSGDTTLTSRLAGNADPY